MADLILLAMAEWVAIIGAAVKYIGTLYAAGGFWATVIKTVIAVGLGVLAQSLQSKPKRGGARDSGQNLMVRQPNYPRRLIYGKARVGGIWFFVETTGSRNQFLQLVLGICDGPIESIDAVFFGDKELTLDADGNAGGDYEGKLRIKLYKGDQTDADVDLIAESDNWTVDHRLLGIAYAYIRMEHSDDVFKSGLEDFSFVIRGRNDIYDPRTDTTSYSNNPALCWNHYLTLQTIGPGADDSEIDQDYLEDAADTCDEAVDLLAGGTEARYACDGVISLDTNPEDIAAGIVASMQGKQLYVNGKFRVIAGAYRTPTFEITESMIVGPIKLRNRAPKDERVNLVQATYRDPLNKYQPFDAPQIENATYQTADGETLMRDLDLDFTISGARAQRLMKIEMERSRQETTLELICNFKAWPVQAGENATVTIGRYGFNQKVFSVDAMSLATQDDAPVLRLNLSADAESVYDWNAATEEKPINIPNSLSARGLSLNLTATPAPPGPETKVAHFQGDDDYLAVADSAALDYITGTQTMMCWVKYRDSNAQEPAALIMGQLRASSAAGSSIGIRGYFSNTHRDLGVVIRNSSGIQQFAFIGPHVSGPAIPVGQWLFVWVTVFVFDDGGGQQLSVKIYAKSEDGTFEEENFFTTAIGVTISNGTSDFTIGANPDGIAEFRGDIGPCAIWSEGKFNAVRDALYNSGRFLYRSEIDSSAETGLVEWWDMQEAHGTREGSENTLDLAEANKGVGAALGQDPDYPLDVVLESDDLNAVILYSFTENSLSKNDLGSGSNQTDGNPGTISVADGTPITAQAYVEESGQPVVVSNIVRGVYNYIPGDLSAATLEWHFEACRGLRLASGALEAWHGQSGNEIDAVQATAANRPTWIENAVNGRPAIRFNGVDQFLSVPQAFAGTTSRTLFVVIKSSETGSAAIDENIFFDLQDGAAPSAGAAWAIAWRKKLAVVAADPSTGGYFTFNSDIISGKWYVAQIQWFGTHIQEETDLLLNFRVQPDSGDFASVAINTAATTNSLIGKTNMFSGSFFSGDIAEIMLFNGVMTSSERRFLHYHLRGKYGLT